MLLYKNHLDKGVKKGAFTAEEADKRFEAWMKEKEAKVEAKRSGLSTAAQKAEADRLKAEKAKNEERAAALAAAAAPIVEEVTEETPAAEEVAEATEEAPAEETTEETPVAEETPAAEETPTAEAAEEASAATDEENNEEKAAE